MRHYIPAFDGIRGYAALAVLIVHASTETLPGGGRGVDVFFVLSGYLTTTIALSGRYSVREFMIRRARRIWPLLIFVGLMVAPFSYLAGKNVWIDVLPAALFLESPLNIATGPIYTMSHAWTLSIEMMFYAFIAVCAGRMQRVRLRSLMLWACAIGTIARILSFYLSWGDFAYFSPLTHSTGLFLGAALATFKPGHFKMNAPSTYFALLVIGLTMSNFAGTDAVPRLARGPMVELATTAVIASVVSGTVRPTAILTAGPIRFLGRISYGIYLWHFPLNFLVGQVFHGLVAAAVLLALSVAVATVTYYAVELPFRKMPKREPAAFPAAPAVQAVRRSAPPGPSGNA